MQDPGNGAESARRGQSQGQGHVRGSGQDHDQEQRSLQGESDTYAPGLHIAYAARRDLTLLLVLLRLLLLLLLLLLLDLARNEPQRLLRDLTNFAIWRRMDALS